MQEKSKVMSVRVIVNGAKGKMGQEASKAIEKEDGLELVGQADLGDDLKQLIAEQTAQVVVDFTTAAVAFDNTQKIIEAHACPVIGTSGIMPEQVNELRQLCVTKKLGGVIVPNFAMGAVLMMKFAKEAAKYMPHIEIVEMHHDRKADAPSGTAIYTLKLLNEAREQTPIPILEKELLPGARGAQQEGIHIHSVRLPGYVAHQQVLFGGNSETLTIRHDSTHRESFMSGVCFAAKKVVELKELIYGLEHLL